MKIAIDCRMIKMSGIGVYLQNILKELLKVQSNTYYLFGSENDLELFRSEPNFRIISCEIPIFSFRELYDFPIKKLNECDVFYSPNYNIPCGIRVPIYSTIHDVVFLDVDGLTSKLGRYIRRLALWRAVWISKKIFTVSQFSADRIKFHFKVNKPIVVVKNSLKQSLLDFKNSGCNDKYNFEYILFVGNIKKHKGLKYLFDAYEILIKEKNFKHKLVIVGSFENFKSNDIEIFNRIDNVLKDKIIFTGQLNDNELYEIISNAALLVQPSLYEGFGIPPLEALYLGCEVVLSDIDVFKEIYQGFPVNFFSLHNSNKLSESIIWSLDNKINNNLLVTKQEIVQRFNS